MSKKNCGEYFRLNGSPVICGTHERYCPDCQAYDGVMSEAEAEAKAIVFEVINTKNITFIRYNNRLVNIVGIHVISLLEKDICLTFNSREKSELRFNTEAEAQAAFEKIMGGKSGSPTSRELKENKTRHHAIQEEQIEYLE